jgi:hypothetical protein
MGMQTNVAAETWEGATSEALTIIAAVSIKIMRHTATHCDISATIFLDSSSN